MDAVSGHFSPKNSILQSGRLKEPGSADLGVLGFRLRVVRVIVGLLHQSQLFSLLLVQAGLHRVPHIQCGQEGLT